MFSSVLHALFGFIIIIGSENLCVDGKKASSALSDILDDLDLRTDNRIRPGYGENAIEIQAFVFLRNIIEINEAQSTITLSLLLMQMWDDPGLAFQKGSGNIEEILIDNIDYMSRFWNPDIFIVNEVKTHTCLASSEYRHLAHQIIRLTSTGSILKTSRLTVTVSCPMRHQNYPFHGFKCDIELESFGHKSTDLVFEWRNGSKSVDHSKLDMNSLAMKTSYSLISVDTHSQQNHLDTGGSYSKLIIRLVFQKLWLRHAITFFIPTMALTIVSLFTLWLLDCGRSNIRNCAGIGILTNFVIAGFIILLATLEYLTTPILAQVPLLTPIDFQIGTCLTTVFASVTYHCLSFCCKKSCCCLCCCDSADQQKSLKSRHSKGQISKRESRNQKSEEGSTYTKVTCYDSYDVTDVDEDAIDEQLHPPQEPLRHVADHKCEGGNNGTINDIIGNGKDSNAKMSQAPRQSKVAVIWRVFLHLSKSFTTASFFVAEFFLCYTYILTSNVSYSKW